MRYLVSVIIEDDEGDADAELLLESIQTWATPLTDDVTFSEDSATVELLDG